MSPKGVEQCACLVNSNCAILGIVDDMRYFVRPL